MATITSAGAGSGIDLESVISASVAAKKAQLQTPITKQQSSAQVTLSGLGSLKSAISTYMKTLSSLSEVGAFNKRTVNITQNSDDPVLSVETQTGVANGEYNITVNNLAQNSKFSAEFTSASAALVSTDGQLTFAVGDNSFMVDVKANDTLQTIRNKINNNGDNFGVTANIITTADGTVKLVLDSGVSGDKKDMTITGSTDELKIFDPTADITGLPNESLVVSKMEQTLYAKSAEIQVDGSTTLKSDTNTFDNTIQGLKITVLKTSDTDSSGAPKSNKVAITKDTSGIKDLIQQFIDGYNTLMDKTAALGKRNTVSGGETQDDGGDLAGDSITRSVSNLVRKSIMNSSTVSTAFSTIFEVGVEMDKNGKLSLDSDKLSDALDQNFEQVIALFGEDGGLASNIENGLKQYTQTGGTISLRQDSLNTQLRYLSQKQDTVTTQLTKYEEALRTQYGNLDAMLVKMNQSASYLSALSTSSS